MSLSSDDAAVKRQRVSRACDLCRKKKIKCDGTTPVCGNCEAFSLQCTFKDTTKKRGPPKGYIEAIENRLHKLESYLNGLVKSEENPRTKEILKELQSPLETPSGEQIKARPQRRQSRRSANSQATKNIGIELKATPDSSNMDSPMSPLFNSPTFSHSELPDDDDTEAITVGSPSVNNDGTGQLSMDETGQVRYLGKSSGFYLLQNSRTYQNGAFHFSGYNYRRSYDSQGEKKKLIEGIENTRRNYLVDPLELPPKDLSEHLVLLYLTHFYPVLPMFYKHNLMSFDSSQPISPLLLNSIYAIASRVSPDVRVRSDSASPDTAGDVFFERARCLLDDYYDTPRISTVQALLLMASHQMGATKAARAWLYSGMAFRMAQDLGLNRNCDHWNISLEEKERRKRVFWCCYIVDRITSAVYGRSANFEERDCDVPFPTIDDDKPISSNSADPSRRPVRLLELFIQFIKISDILGHVLKNIYYAKAKHYTSSRHIDHMVTTFNHQLTHWHDSLPEALQYKLPNTQNGEKAPDPPSPICQLHLMYYTTVILLHRSFIPGPTQTQLPTTLPSYKLCESAAVSILDIINIMLGENHFKYVYNFTVYFTFTAGIIFIKLASSLKDPDRAFDAKINVNRIMRALDDLEATWMNAARCCNILGDLAGLRDINLECNKYVPKKVFKTSPPPSIAVPNSPENATSSSLLRSSFLGQELQEEPDTIMDDRPLIDQVNYNWNSNSNNTRCSSLPAVTQQRQQPNRTATDFSSFSLFSSPTPVSSVRQSIQPNSRSSSLDVLKQQQNSSSNSSPFLSQLSRNDTTAVSMDTVNNSKSSTAYMDTASSTMDPFAAPDIVPSPSQQQQEQFDPFGTAFWGMPTSLDTNEWNAYFGNQQNNSNNDQRNGSTGTSIDNNSSSYLYSLTTPYKSNNPKRSDTMENNKSRNISDDPLDMLNSPSQSLLFNFLGDN